nr:oligosaccharide flippase family protein [Vibrio splendidus]
MSLFKNLKSNFIWRIFYFILQFLSLAIYSRMFEPDVFGVVATVFVFITLFQIVCEFGLTTSIINKENVKNNDIDSLFGFTLLFGIMTSVLFILLSKYILLGLYGEVFYASSVYMMPALFFYSLGVVPLALLNKSCLFKITSLVDIFSELIVLVIIICSVFLFNLNKTVALSIKYPLFCLIRFLISYYLNYRVFRRAPRFSFLLVDVKEYFSFGKFQFISSLCNYSSRNLDTMLISYFIGSYATGLYDRSYQLMKYPITILTFSIMPALQPAINKENLSVKDIEKVHRFFFSYALYIAILTSFFIFNNVNNIVLFIFGDGWAEITPIIKILCFAIPVQVVLSSSSPFILSAKKPKYMMLSSILSSITTCTIVLFSVINGDVYDVAIAVVIAFNINGIQSYMIMYNKVFEEKLMKLALSLFKVIVFSVFACVIYYLLVDFVSIDSYLYGFVFNLLIAGLVLASSLFVLYKRNLL